MVVVPRARPAPVIPSAPRPDTLEPIAASSVARTLLITADSQLVAARAQIAAIAPPAPPPDTAVIDPSLRDSIEARAAEMDRLIARAEQAPLPASYKALAEMPELRGDARVRALVDSLNDIEREREGFGAVGGVDPIFVALTSHASQIGRTIQGIAVSRRDAMRASVRPAAVVAPVATVPSIDTMKIVVMRDSARVAFQQANDSLLRRRQVSQALDLQEQRARERASAVAPTLALLASAFVLSAVIGFAGALVGELRRPRVADAAEVERLLGVRVLSTVETTMPSTERGRRQADRSAPPYFDPGAEAYQLAYLGLATEHPTLLAANVTGDDPAITAVVACNLAAVAAEEARNTLVADLDPASLAAAALRTRGAPGITDIVRESATWPDATVTASVGRDKSIDLVPFGSGAEPGVEKIKALFERDTARIARYYDAVIVIVSPSEATAGVLGGLPSHEIVFCARPGTTPLRELTARLDEIRAAGGRVRGIVLWASERPRLRGATNAAKHTHVTKEEPVLAGS